MTREEFDTWIEQHYGELLSVAKAHGARDPEDVVQTAVVRMLEHGGYANTKQPWTWACLYVRGEEHNQKRAAQRFRSVKHDLKVFRTSGAYQGEEGQR